MAMAARKIVAEPLTITGSIGVITGKFNLAELYRRAGYAKTSISKGRRVSCRRYEAITVLSDTALGKLKIGRGCCSTVWHFGLALGCS